MEKKSAQERCMVIVGVDLFIIMRILRQKIHGCKQMRFVLFTKMDLALESH